MNFSQADIDLLRLLRWGRYIMPNNLEGLFSQTTIRNMVALGYIKQHKKSGAFILATKGKQLLNRTLSHLPPDTPLSYHSVAVQRRIRLSKLLITAYRSSADVFTTGVEDLSDTPSLYIPAITRGQGNNPWGNTRIAALAHLGDLLCAVHYVCPGIGSLSLTDELMAFNNQTAHLPGLRRSFLFAGDTYEDVLAEVTAVEDKSQGKLISYGRAYRCLALPVRLLSCDDVGATQLQIMATPDYRRRLAMAVLRGHYQPPPEDMAEWDAMYQGTPFIMAADMDLRRVDAGLDMADAHNCEQMFIACLGEQAKSVLIPRYRRSGKVRFLAVKQEALAQTLGHPVELHTPPETPYMTEKGDFINAPLIQAAGKAGGCR